jgi:hypothetical protein
MLESVKFPEVANFSEPSSGQHLPRCEILTMRKGLEYTAPSRVGKGYSRQR